MIAEQIKPTNQSEKGWYVVKKIRNSTIPDVKEEYYTTDIWVDNKWLFSSLLNSPIIEVVKYVNGMTFTEMNELIRKMNA